MHFKHLYAIFTKRKARRYVEIIHWRKDDVKRLLYAYLNLE